MASSKAAMGTGGERSIEGSEFLVSVDPSSLLVPVLASLSVFKKAYILLYILKWSRRAAPIFLSLDHLLIDNLGRET